jgi:quercetin dioxygenase-like cupin family protein
MEKEKNIFIDENNIEWETWKNHQLKELSPVYWKTLVDKNITKSTDVAAGVFILPENKTFIPHFHKQQEIYYIISGEGLLSVNKYDRKVEPGSTAVIPEKAEHSLKNTGYSEMKVFYVFSADSFNEIDYNFT